MPGPLFFVDRSLGRVRVPALLRESGWAMVSCLSTTECRTTRTLAMVHVENRQLKRGVDDEVVALAVAEERVPVSADTDFESGGCRFGDVQR